MDLRDSSQLYCYNGQSSITLINVLEIDLCPDWLLKTHSPITENRAYDFWSQDWVPSYHDCWALFRSPIDRECCITLGYNCQITSCQFYHMLGSSHFDMPPMFQLIQMKLYWCVACLKEKAGTGADQNYFISNVSNVLCLFTSNWTLFFSDYYLFYQHKVEDLKKKNNNHQSDYY